jgi:hypothetical protein
LMGRVEGFSLPVLPNFRKTNDMNFKHLKIVGLVLVLGLGVGLLGGCGGDDDATEVVVNTPPITSYDEILGWTCDSGESCQDVYNIKFAAGTVVDISAIDVTGGSILQMAFYAPGVSLGRENLLTGGSREELRCNYVAGCVNNTGGQAVTGLVIGAAGTYRLAITRNWDISCGSSGDYRLMITADVEFTTPVNSGQDVATKAVGVACP